VTVKGNCVRCFFCLEEKAPSLEHVFPEAIGGTLETERVCTSCNSFLGHKVDVLLTDHPAILRKRHEFGMTTSAGKPVDPMGKLFRQGALASDPEKRIQTFADPVTGKMVPKMLAHRRQTKDEDGNDIVEVALDVSDLGALEKIVQRHRKSAGLEPLPDEDIQTLVADARRNMRTLEQTEVLYSGEMDIFHYQRAICKIAYELACIWIGDSYLDDPRAQALRDFILKGTDGEVSKAIRLDGGIASMSLWQSEPNAHIGLAVQQGNDIAVWVRIFDAVSGVILITNAAPTYPSLKDGRFLLIDLCGRDSRNGTLTDEFFRTRQSRDAARP
jgi:HNH endonuclease